MKKTVNLFVFINRAFLSLCSVLFLISCNNSENQLVSHDQKTTIKTYKHSEDGRPNSLDPIKASSVYSSQLVVNIFDTLYSYKYLKRPYELKPNLAKAMPQVSKDGLTYVIEIKKGVLFTDHISFPGGVGREVIADDFVYSIMRTFDPSNNATGQWLWRDKIIGLNDWINNGANYNKEIPGLMALDDHTIQIKLNKPYSQLIYTLATAYSAIVPKEAVEHFGQRFGVSPVGSGPFVLDDFSDTVAYLTKNESFRQEPLNIHLEGFDSQLHEGLGFETLHMRSPPFIDKLEVHFIKESSSRWLSFNKSNEVQFTTLPKEKQNTVVESTDPLVLKQTIAQEFNSSFDLEAGFVYHGFNMLDPNFGDVGDEATKKRNKALRCAIRGAHDWNQKNRAFYFNLGTVFPGVIPPSLEEFDPNLSDESIRVNINHSNAILSQNDWYESNLPVFEYHTNTSALQKQFFEQMRGFLSSISYPNDKIIYKPHASFGQFNQAVKDRKAPFFYLAWTFDYPDAENVLQLFYGPNETPGSNNFNYKNPEFDRLYELSSTMPQSPERTEIYRKMNQMIIDDCVVISGLSRKKINLWHKNVITYPDREVVGGFHLKYVDIN